MKIYTRKGDDGSTGLIGGTRVSKGHLRVEAYGTVDELNSWIGALRNGHLPVGVGKVLLSVQERLFEIGAALASDPEKSKMAIPDLREEDVQVLEKEIDRMESMVEPLKNFILPGGHVDVSRAHLARCVCRRAERDATRLSGESPVENRILVYLNRLSDYLFVLSRVISSELEITEMPWKPRG